MTGAAQAWAKHVLAVHAGPGIAVAVATVWWGLRRGPDAVTLEPMTERKPPQMSYRSWIDQQIEDAERRGLFDDLAGCGQAAEHQAGVPPTATTARRGCGTTRAAGVAAEEMLPTPLRLRREIERLRRERAGEFRSESEVREAAADLNRRIVEWRRIPVGPPVHVRLVNADDMVNRWRTARAARVAAEAGAAKAAKNSAAPTSRSATAGALGEGAADGTRSWWRSFLAGAAPGSGGQRPAMPASGARAAGNMRHG